VVKERVPPRKIDYTPERPSPEEIKRRQESFKRVDKLRKKTGIVINDAATLIRELRGEWIAPS
jgi:hypothetical protein